MIIMHCYHYFIVMLLLLKLSQIRLVKHFNLTSVSFGTAPSFLDISHFLTQQNAAGHCVVSLLQS